MALLVPKMYCIKLGRISPARLWSSVYATLLLLQLVLRCMTQHTDNCDWTIWDGMTESRGVRNIYGRCSEGRIDWRHPFGAVRVSLQLGTRNETNFETCFIAKSHFVHAKISLEDSTTPSSPSLIPLLTLNSTHPQMNREMCFQSKGRPVVLYMEALYDRQATNLGHIELDYDNQRIFPQVHPDEMEDCRPCTDSELLYEVCSSDFVIRGTIDAVFHRHELQESTVHLSVDKIHRQKGNIFKESQQQIEGRTLSQSSQNLGTPSYSNIGASNSISKTSDGQLYTHSKCGIRHGHGTFLFMGKIRLKRAILKCAPRLEDFESMWREAVRNGDNICLLD